MRTPSFCPSMVTLVAILLSVSWTAAPSQRGDAKAPDGRHGFGVEVDLGDLLKQMRTPSKAEQAFVLELETLARDVGVLADVTEGFYRDRGFFEILDPVEDPTLERLHEIYARYEVDPSVVANRPARFGRAFARMFLDSRFRVRRQLLSGWSREADEIRRGLSVLEGAAHGYVLLDQDQAVNITRRIDLSAAMLRSIRSDLESLREPLDSPNNSTVSGEQVADFLAMFDIGDRKVREATQASIYELNQTSELRMRAVLFTERLRNRAKELFDWRSSADLDAHELLKRAIEADPSSRQEGDIPRSISKLSKSKRRKLSREKSLAGLAANPLDDELAWVAGLMSSFVFGELETTSHFDRFLVLRRISYRDDSTYAGRELTERERFALQYVQEIDRRVSDHAGD